MSAPTLSRQRSCAECVRGKRKCGLELPRCRRCQKRKVPCSYPNRPSMIDEVKIPELDFPWLDDLMKDPGLAPWSGNLAPELAKDAPLIAQKTVCRHNPDDLIDQGENSRSTIPRIETEGAVRQFKSWPDKWLKEGRAPFIHPRVYSSSMPKALQDAYAACAIYATMTTQNAFVAFTVVESKANELLRSSENASWSPLDLLAAVQALLIFQLIRLFDGDIRQRALAEKADPVLQAWTEQLKACTEEERKHTPANAPSWRSWIFAESVRRTVIMSFFLSGLYSLVKTGACGMSDKVNANSFTGQKNLWTASSALEWERAKQACRAYWIEHMDFAEVLQDGNCSDLDDFGHVMITTYKGQDVIDHWIASGAADWSLLGGPNLQQSLLDLI